MLNITQRGYVILRVAKNHEIFNWISMNHIVNNLLKLQQRIKHTESTYGRTSHSVQLIAVSKTKSVSMIEQAIAAGQIAFGENYVQEAIEKIIALEKYNLEWHFIGTIQSNKTKSIAKYFQWVHSVDTFNIAERLSKQRHPDLPPLNICIQVNIDEEKNKSGTSLNELTEVALAINQLPQLKLRGLMTIPAPRKTFIEQRKTFHQLNTAFQQLNKAGLSLDTLSMGMSEDFEAAIAEGATLIRIGTAIFGARDK